MIDFGLAGSFHQHFGAAPSWKVWGPGRVNLIGEHTDYNEGFVLPMAIDAGIRMAAGARDDRRVVVRSLNLGETLSFDLDSFQSGTGWGEYIKGVAWALQVAGHALRGWQGVLHGDVPIGSGLSSSAALEIAVARAFAQASGFAWERTAMAKLAQRAENEWVGVQCGIMDQLVAAAGTAGHALLIDCRSLATQAVRVPEGTAVVVLDTGTRRSLATSAYNDRRGECAAAATLLGARSLRDVSARRLAESQGSLPPVLARRARHVVSENERTLAAARSMAEGDAAALGRLMSASHASLRDDFQVSSRELDLMVRCAQNQETCLGARMTGAGFGGCAVALVREAAVTGFVEEVLAAYSASAEPTPAAYVVRALDGAWAMPWGEQSGEPF